MIGIGAGPSCDGQVLVTHDLLGLFTRFPNRGASATRLTAAGGYPKFVKQYVNLEGVIKEGVSKFRREVKKGSFPDRKHSYPMDEEELRKFLRGSL